MQINVDVVYAHFSGLNFHMKRYKDSGPKLSLTIQNKWSVGWTKVWFYCRVPIHRSPEGGKSIYALHSHMSALDYLVETLVNCLDTDSNDVTFVRAMTMIGGHDTIKEFLACELYPLSVMSVLSGDRLRNSPAVPSFHKLR
jgi:hypothetical protein